MPIDEIEVIKQKLVDQIKPIGVYLFGSFANGTAHADSDFDQMARRSVPAAKPGRILQLSSRLHHPAGAMDVLPLDHHGSVLFVWEKAQLAVFQNPRLDLSGIFPSELRCLYLAAVHPTVQQQLHDQPRDGRQFLE